MTAISFHVGDARVERFAAAPSIRLRVRVSNEAERVDAMALRVQVQIEPAARVYNPNEELQLTEVFGDRERWAYAVRPLQWTESAIVVGAFAREASFEIALPCTYDLNVISGKYISALEAGGIPLRLMFTGTIFRSAAAGFNAEMLPWSLESTTRLPVALWQEAMESAFGDDAWIRVGRSTFNALRRYRAEQKLYRWEDTFERLLSARPERVL